MWQVSNEVAQQTLDLTKQLKKKDADSTLYCRLVKNYRMLRYKILESLFYTDKFYSKQFFSKRVFPMMQLFVSDKGFFNVYGMKS